MATIYGTQGSPTPYRGTRYRVKLVQVAQGLDSNDRPLVDDEVVDPYPGRRVLLSPPMRSPDTFMAPVRVALERVSAGTSVPTRITVTARYRRGS